MNIPWLAYTLYSTSIRIKEGKKRYKSLVKGKLVKIDKVHGKC